MAIFMNAYVHKYIPLYSTYFSSIVADKVSNFYCLQMTIGYGVRYPNEECPEAIIIMVFEVKK